MRDLIARLEAAEVGDDDLSLDVNIALEGGVGVPKMANYVMEPIWAIRRPNEAYRGGFENGPNYPVTKSIDAAVSIGYRVLDGDFSYDLFHDFGGFNRAKVHGITDRPVSGEGKAETMPLALCIAILRAKLAEEPTKG